MQATLMEMRNELYTPAIKRLEELRKTMNRLENIRKAGTRRTISPRTRRIMETIVRDDEVLDMAEGITW